MPDNHVKEIATPGLRKINFQKRRRRDLAATGHSVYQTRTKEQKSESLGANISARLRQGARLARLK
jgi:hypothetical protein